MVGIWCRSCSSWAAPGWSTAACSATRSAGAASSAAPLVAGVVLVVGFSSWPSVGARLGRADPRLRRLSRRPRSPGSAFHWLQAPVGRRPQDHGSDRGLPPISRRRRGGPARRAESAREDAGTVRALPALRGRARRGERLGQRFAGVLAAAGVAAAASRLVRRQLQRRPAIRSQLRRARSAAISTAPSRRPRAPPGSSGSGGGSSRRRLVRRRRRWWRRRRVVSGAARVQRRWR